MCRCSWAESSRRPVTSRRRPRFSTFATNQSSLPEVKAELIANTEQAVARGAFGSPTFFVGNEMWFGKERLEAIEEAIRG
jgi:2-hydroxychromene-2-carboxylate isomerase